MTFDPLVVGIVATVAGGLILFILRAPIQHFITQRQEKKREQNKKLRIHFGDVKKEAIEIIKPSDNLIEWYGAILVSVSSLKLTNWNNYFSKFGAALLPQPSNIFAAHLPKETSELAEQRRKIEKHNRRRIDLDSIIKRDFESRNISVVHDSSNRPFYIYDTIFIPLFQWWQECNKQKANPSPNFNKIGTKPDGGPNNLYAEGWGSQAIAYAKTDYGKKKCKHAIHDIAHNEEYQMYASWLIRLSDSLVREVHEFAQQLSNILDNVERFWPGTKSYRFKKEMKRCTRCKEIFS